MSEPKRSDFPPGLDGFKAWRRACGALPDPHDGPWDPAKWGDFAQRPPARPVGPVRLERGTLQAEIYAHLGPPPSDLRVRVRGAVPGADAPNRLLRDLHPMELQHVAPAVTRGEQVLLGAHDPGHPMVRGGREAMLLLPSQPDAAWQLTTSDPDRPEGSVAHGRRHDLVAMLLLYVDTAIGSAGGAAVNAPWVKRLLVARTALHEELDDRFVVERPPPSRDPL